MDSKGIYTLKEKNDNFPTGQIEYDFNNINGFSAMKVTSFLQKNQYVATMSQIDQSFNACLFALAANQDMGAIMALKMSDFQSVAFLAMNFFLSGLGVEPESSIQAENIEK